MTLPGCVNITGVLSTYMKSYFGLAPDNDIASDLLPFTMFILMFIMPIGTALIQRNWNPRLLIILGACISFPCFFGASFIDSSNFIGFAILFALGFSVNNGINYMVPVHHAWLWFPENSGLVSGIILGGFGFGSLIFDNVFTHVVNPDNLPYDDETG